MDLPGYDAWKLATPWDDEVAAELSFTCHNCEKEQTQECTVSNKPGTTYLECDECGAENNVDYGDDE